MKKLFKPHPKQQDDLDQRDRDRERAISPFTVVPGPPSPDAQQHYAQLPQQQAVPRERPTKHTHNELERDRTYRNSMVAAYPYPNATADDISSWELIQVHGQHAQNHPYRTQNKLGGGNNTNNNSNSGSGGIADRERSGSLASLNAHTHHTHLITPIPSPGALPNPHPYAQNQPPYPPYAHPPANKNASRTSSLNSIPPAPGPGNVPPPGSAGSGSYVPSPTSPSTTGHSGSGSNTTTGNGGGAGVLRKKSAQLSSPQGTAAILRALDPSMMGMAPPPPPVHTHNQHQHQYQQQKTPLMHVSSVRSTHRNTDPHPHPQPQTQHHGLPHPHLRVPLLSSRKDKEKEKDKSQGQAHLTNQSSRSTNRDRSRSLSLSDIEFGPGAADHDLDDPRLSIERELDPAADLSMERDSLEMERKAREARWRERDLEIEGKAPKKGRESKGFFERLQIGDGERDKDREDEREKDRREEKKEKKEKEKDDWKAPWTNLFSKDKDKDKDKERSKNKKDNEAIDPLTPLPPHSNSHPHTRMEISNPMPLMHGQPPPPHFNPNINIDPVLNSQHAYGNLAPGAPFQYYPANTAPAPMPAVAAPTPGIQAQPQSQPQLQAAVQPQGQGQGDPLARMVGLFVSPAYGDEDGVNWVLAFELCERTKARSQRDSREGKEGKEREREGRDVKEAEVNAKAIAKALRKELKYARPSEQLGAVALWAMMLQNASDFFITQTSSRKFLDVVEDIILQTRSEILRDRLIEVLGAAAYLANKSTGKDAAKRENFKSLWRKVKPELLPEEGMELSTDNPMFRSPSKADKRSRPPTGERQSSRNGIISVDEDIRRLFQECKIGRGNAQLLNEALAFATPEDLKEKDIIKEFYAKCKASQELIHAQIPWASAGAERSRARQLESIGVDGMQTADDLPSTREETLLAELLVANEELTEALRIHGDIERIGFESEAERKARERSKVEVRATPMEYQMSGEASSFLAAPSVAPSSSRSPSPSSFFMNSHTSQASFNDNTAAHAKHNVDHPISTSGSPFHLQQHLAHVQSANLSGSDSSHSRSDNHSQTLVQSQGHPLSLGQNHLAPAPSRQLHGPRSPAPSGGGAAAAAAAAVVGVGGATGAVSRGSSPVPLSRPTSVARSRATSVDVHLDGVDLKREREREREGDIDTTVDETAQGAYGAMANHTIEPYDLGAAVDAMKLSEKVAGKRRMMVNEVDLLNDYGTPMHDDGTNSTFPPDDGIPAELLRPDYDVEDGAYVDETCLGPDRWKVKTRYAYDAAAERSKERMRLEMVAGGLG